MNKKIFLKISLIFVVSLCWAAQTTQIPLPGTAIFPFAFTEPLPILSAAGGTMTTYVDTGVPFEIHMREFKSMMLPAGVIQGYPGTWVWGYIVGSTVPTTLDTYIGPVIVATRNQASKITFYNDLGDTSSTNVLAWKYSTDQTMHWADPLNIELNPYMHFPEPGGWPFGVPGTLNYGEDPATPGSFLAKPIPAVVHLHGGEVPPVLDGGPDAWVTSNGAYSGHGYYTFGQAQGVPAPGNYFQYNYPNTQEAANIWFHDHVLGITRLNVYAGLAGAYVLVDPSPVNLPPGDLSDPTKIVPVVIQDRMFDTNGQLFFPADSAGGVLWTTNPEHPYWVPEFLGDVIVVNGKAWPYLEVQPALYRLLFINGSNARTYSMWIDNPVTGVKAPWWVIGTDGGYLDNPVGINKLTMMPGERYDVIVDFTGLTGNFVLHNNARTPFPKGVPPTGPITLIMMFRVNPAATTAPITFDPALGTALRPAMVRLPGTPLGPVVSATNVQLKRQLTLNEVMGPPQIVQDPVTGVMNTAYPGGPLEVVLNNTKWSGLNPLGFKANPAFTEYPPAGSFGPVFYSELPDEGTTEQWEIINVTADAHPIHLHLVQFQVMNRQNFNVNKYWGDYQVAFDGGGIDPMTGQPYPVGVFMPGYGPPNDYLTPNPDGAVGGNPGINARLQGKAIPPAPEEQGWKDTVISYPGQVLRLSVRWAPTDLPNTTAAIDAWFPFDPNGGHGYVWHCHIIDHEDNEMMRPTSVIPNPTAPIPRLITNY